MDLKELILRIKGDSSGAESALGKVGTATNKFGGIVKTIIAGAAVAAVVSFGKSCINAASEAQTAEVLLRNSLGNVKGMTDKAKDSAVDWVNSMEKSKSFDDAEISAALQRVIVKTGNLKTSQEYLSVAMEVARNRHLDLASATALLDTAYNGSAKALKLFGIEAKEGATGMDYLNQIQEKVKGSGDAWSKTLEGQRAAFKTTFGNFQEAIGGFLMPIAEKFMNIIQPFLQKGMSWISAHLPQIQAVIDTLVKGISWVVETAGKMYGAIKPFIISVTETMGPYVKELFDWLGKHGISLQTVLVSVATGVGEAFTILAAIVKGVIDSIVWAIDKAKEAITWLKTVAANQGVNQGGVYAPAKVATTSPGRTLGVTPHAAGGWVGLNGPEIALVGEKGPEYITPAGQSTGGDNRSVVEATTEVKKLEAAYKAAAEAIMQSRQDIADKIYALTHTEQETEQRALDQEYAANVASSKDKLASKTLYTAESKALVQKYGDAVKVVRQTITDKIYTLTHTDLQNAQRALDQEYAANLLSSKDKLASKALYVLECKKLGEEQTKTEQEELDKRLEAQQKHNDDVASATKTLMDQIDALTLSGAEQQAKDIATQAQNSYEAGVDPSIVKQFMSAATGKMISDSASGLTDAVAGGQTTLDAWAKKDAETRGAIAKYDSGPSIVKAVKDIGTTIVAAVTGVASGVGSAINGLGRGSARYTP